MTNNTDGHTCSYYCERPECVRRQRDELRDRLEAALAQQPAAPSGEVVATDPVYRAGYAAGVADSRNNECACTRTVAVTAPQQPAGVDRARFRKAPCYLCGYNGPGYFQPETHPCAALYHAAQQQGGAE